MNRSLLAALFLLVFPIALSAQAVRYESHWDSLDKRATPSWYDDAKFGIFIHWGVYSVPAYADPHSKVGESYAEWYWNHMHEQEWAHVGISPGSTTGQIQVPGFRRPVQGGAVRPRPVGRPILKSGARYVVLTSKHHEGFCLWPCPASWNWNSVDVGPHRDLAGDLAEAVGPRGSRWDSIIRSTSGTTRSISATPRYVTST